MRRLVLFLEESLFRGTQWVVFEPNDELLWALVPLNVGTLCGTSAVRARSRAPRRATRSSSSATGETTTRDDHSFGIVNIVVGLAPSKPAAFVIIPRSSRSPDSGDERRRRRSVHLQCIRVSLVRKLQFRVKWDGRYGGVIQVSAFKRKTEVVRHREGGDLPAVASHRAGQEFDTITRERRRRS